MQFELVLVARVSPQRPGTRLGIRRESKAWEHMSDFREKGILNVGYRPIYKYVLQELLVLHTLPSTNQTPQNQSHDGAINHLLHSLVCIIAHFSKIKGCLGSVSSLDTALQALVHSGNLVNGLSRIMHSPLAHALSRPRPLTRLPSCTKTRNARQTDN